MQDQPELDANYVYAGVHADGPTRVLCFSNTKDQYTRGSNEESVALLTAKLQRLEERIKVQHAACSATRDSVQLQEHILHETAVHVAHLSPA